MNPGVRGGPQTMHIRLGDVDTFYEEHGAGAPLVLLHPGGADSRAWAANLPPLAARFRVYTPDRRGHGRTPDVPGPITFDAMARDTIAFIEAVAGGPVDLVGCSDGASVGLLVAHLRPDLVRRLVFVCGVWHHTGWLPGSIELDAEADAFLGDWYGEVSPDGREHWPVVKAKLYDAHLAEPALTTGDLARIPCPVLIMQADRDEMPIAHSVALLEALPDAQLAVVPGTSHGLLVEKPELCNAMIAAFLT
jgi:pimeloyl-ACP methyl ester carboxylesterase